MTRHRRLHGVEVRADCMAIRVEVDDTGRATGVTYLHEDRERFQRTAAVAVAGYSIETPRLLLQHSTSTRFPHGLGNDHDQAGRYAMVQGASPVAGRFPERMRMHKAPTQGAANPALAVMAAVSRLAERLV